MVLLIVLMLLTGGLALLSYVVWAHHSEKGPRPARHQATQSRGDRPMTGVAVGTEREQVIRWMEERMSVVEAVRHILHERDQFKAVAVAAQQECERLRHEGEQLRAEVSRLTAESERVQRERAETAQWVAARMTEAAARLRSEPPPA
jgi:hypothetical protein